MGKERGQTRGRERRPRGQQQSPRSGTRIVVLLAFGLCLIAVFGVLSSSGDDGGSAGQQDAKQQSEQKGSGDSSGNDDANDAAKPLKATYRVRAGDSFASIAEEYDVSVEELQQLNPDIDPRALQPGQKLKLK